MSLFRRQPKHYRLSAAGQLLVDDVEAFLAGKYEGYTRRRGCEIPGWSRLNLIAHGDLESIHAVELAEPPSGSHANDQHDGAWSDVQRLLARQLLVLVGDDPTVLARIQHTSLIPLELRLIKESTSGGPGALEIVQATQSVLRSVS